MTIGTFRDQIIYPDSFSDMRRKGFNDKDLEDYLKKVIMLRRVLFDARLAGNSNLAKSLTVYDYPSLRQNENSHTICHIGENQTLIITSSSSEK